MPSNRPPRLAVIVANGITGDSRVQKIAMSAANDGWDVLLIGRSPTAKIQRSSIGSVKVIRVPVGNDLVRAENARRKSGSKLLQPGSATQNARTYWQTEYESRLRRRAEQMAALAARQTPIATAERFGVRGVSFLDRKVHATRKRLVEWDVRRLKDPTAAVGDWRHDQPNLLELDLAFGPVIERFRPDVIHVNDITMLYTGAVAAARLRRRGHSTKWIYDAHEYVAGVEWPTPRMISGYPQLEREYIGRANAVVTVSPEIAELLQSDHKLGTTPIVVRNTPIRAAAGHSAVAVRSAAGLPADVPLIVYSGYIQAERGLDTAINGLKFLPGVHLVIVADQKSPALATLLRLANWIGVADRVHSVPYVAPNEIVDYLSSADLGIICSKKTINYEISLPTKLAEYVHARLPVVVSDVKTLSAYVRDHAIGKVFESGNAESFANAVRAALAERTIARANISDRMLTELSWEHQAAGLLRLYREVSNLSPAQRDEISWDFTEVRKQPNPSVSSAGKSADASSGEASWRALANTKVKLGLGVANYAGQLSALAAAITKQRADASAEVITRTSGLSFGYPADIYVPGKRMYELDTQIDLLRRVLPRYTHLISDAFTPIFGRLNGPDIAGDLPALTQAGIKTALLCHGSEIRDPERHLNELPYSHYRNAPEGLLESHTKRARHNSAIVARHNLPVYVTTPDLLADVPTATWLPLVVDVNIWDCDRPVMERPRPIVLHAPSKRWTKGTDLFLPGLTEMHDRGLIELRLVEGMPWSTMRDEIWAADIVVDQVAVGCYGTFACEAMAAGKPVVVHVTPEVIKTVQAAVGESVPLALAEPTTVPEAIQQLLDDRSGTQHLGRQARDFVRRLHDGSASAAILNGFLDGRG